MASHIGIIIVVFTIAFDLCGASAPLTVRITGGFVEQSWRIDNPDGSYDLIYVSASVDVLFYPATPIRSGRNFVSSIATNISGSIRVWGRATRYGPNVITEKHFDNPSTYSGGPLPMQIVYEGQSGDANVQNLNWQIGTTRNQDSAIPYHLNYDGSTRLLRLWISLPNPFWYPEEFEYYDSSGSAVVAGQQNVPGELEGRVFDLSTDQPIGGARVRFGNVPQTTALNGSYAYGGIPANTYQLIVTNTGYFPVTNLVAIAPFLIQRHDIKLTPSMDVITFYHESPSQGYLVGHVFVSLTANTGVKQFYGFYPAASPFVGRGQVADDQFTPWDFGISYRVTPAQYRAAARTIAHDLASPPLYTLVGFNCTSWAAKVASAAGIALPDYTLPGGVASDAAFGLSLANFGAGAMYNGGTVLFNQSPTTVLSSGSGVASTIYPIDLSYTGVENEGHTNPSNLAATLGLQYEQVNLGVLNANTTNGLTLILTGVDPARHLVSMKWGDGSAFQRQAVNFSHVYSNGQYSADLLIISPGAVHSYKFTVNVSHSIGTVTNINPTSFPPVETSNQGLKSAQPIPNYPLPLAQRISISNGHALCIFTGAPSELYHIQRSTNLLNGFATITNLTADADGLFIYEDRNTIQNPTAFYRVLLPVGSAH